jgi:hypothetical protein
MLDSHVLIDMIYTWYNIIFISPPKEKKKNGDSLISYIIILN